MLRLPQTMRRFSTGAPGAEMLFIIRHAERLDRQQPEWSDLALRPQPQTLRQTAAQPGQTSSAGRGSAPSPARGLRRAAPCHLPQP